MFHCKNICIHFFYFKKDIFIVLIFFRKLHVLNKHIVNLLKYKISSVVRHKQVFEISQIFRMGLKVLFLWNSALLSNISSNKSFRSMVDLTYIFCLLRILEMRFEEKLFYRKHWDLQVSIITILDFTIFRFGSLREKKLIDRLFNLFLI